MTNQPTSETAVVIERIFDAPVELIWKLWTQPEHFKNWYGPQNFSIPVAEMDLCIGGKRLICMEMPTPDGSMKMWTTGEFLEIVENQRLVYTESMSDEHGNIIEQTGSGGSPTTTQVMVVLEQLANGTKMTMTHAGLPENAQGANSGWNQAFDKLAEYAKTV